MKAVKELRNFRLKPSNVSSSVKYFSQLNIDWDVYLPSLGKNLQREFVWSLEQKRELIWSVLYGRNIPHCALINAYNDEWLVIDGKQRISTLLDFYNDKFSIIIDGEEYLFNQLPEDYKSEISHFYFDYYIINESKPNDISDEDKIKWFKLINFSGTQQDKEHLESLTIK